MISMNSLTDEPGRELDGFFLIFNFPRPVLGDFRGGNKCRERPRAQMANYDLPFMKQTGRLRLLNCAHKADAFLKGEVFDNTASKFLEYRRSKFSYARQWALRVRWSLEYSLQRTCTGYGSRTRTHQDSL